MKIALDISPLTSSKLLSHRVRGTGFYIEHLKQALTTYFPEHEYIFFERGEELPSNIDLVHYPYFEPFFLTLPLFKKHKTVVTVHDLTPLVFPGEFPSGIRGKLKWELQKKSLLGAKTVITDSICSKNDIAKFTGIPKEKINVIYLAAGEEFKKIDSQSAGLKAKIKNIRDKYHLPEKFVLYVGDVSWNKNLPRLIEATKKINVPLILVGNAIAEKNFDRKNPWNQDLMRVQELIELNSKIVSLGFVSTDDLILLYNEAFVFCMPSLYEGFGLPILEAMQSGCPVVTSRNGSLAEVAGNAAYYINPSSVDSIAGGIIEVFSDNKLQNKLSSKGLLQSANFSWEKAARETMKVYEKVINK